MNIWRLNEKLVIIPEVAGRNVHDIWIASGSKKTKDLIQVRSFGESKKVKADANLDANLDANITITFGVLSSIFGNAQTETLASCRGTVDVSYDGLGDVRFVFRNVSQCSKFDILDSKGQKVDYAVKDLARESDGQFRGSFTIPKKYIRGASNSIKVLLRSNGRAHNEVIAVNFLNFN